MDCERFFEAVDAHFGDRAAEVGRTETAGQCVVDFFHPRIVGRFGTTGVQSQFNRSGVVWVPPVDRVRIQLRIPAAHDDAVTDALADAPLPFERTDHRGVSAPDGEMVTVLHYSADASDVSENALDATLAAVATALVV